MPDNEWIQAFGQVHAKVCPDRIVNPDNPLEMANEVCDKVDMLQKELKVAYNRLRAVRAAMDGHVNDT